MAAAECYKPLQLAFSTSSPIPLPYPNSAPQNPHTHPPTPITCDKPPKSEYWPERAQASRQIIDRLGIRLRSAAESRAINRLAAEVSGCPTSRDIEVEMLFQWVGDTTSSRYGTRLLGFKSDGKWIPRLRGRMIHAAHYPGCAMCICKVPTSSGV